MSVKIHSDEKTRAFEMSLELEHPADTVWSALTTAEGLERWFPLAAEVDAGEGGTVKLIWDEQCYFDTRIEAWEPGRRMRLVEQRPDGVPIVMEFTLEGRGGSTVLRLVHSGFGFGGDWDHEFDGISRGWSFELRCLRYHLDHHAGEPRHMVWLNLATELSPEDAYATVLGPQALLAEGSLAGLAEDEPYIMRTAAGEDLGGTVMIHQPPHTFVGVVPSLGDGLIRYEFESTSVFIALMVWGDRKAEADAFEARWRGRLAAIL
jgi:uncharacterized protein YndB with AHSA1/START domain